MDDVFYIKEGDTSPSLRYTLLPAPIVVSGATVRFSMRNRQTTVVKIDRAACAIVDGALGVVQYDWQTADTDTAGVYEAEFEVTYSDGSIETFPNFGAISVVIDADIA